MRVRPGGRERARGNGNTGEASLTDGDQRVMERERQRETSHRARMSLGEGLGENAAWVAAGQEGRGWGTQAVRWRRWRCGPGEWMLRDVRAGVASTPGASRLLTLEPWRDNRPE